MSPADDGAAAAAAMLMAIGGGHSAADDPMAAVTASSSPSHFATSSAANKTTTEEYADFLRVMQKLTGLYLLSFISVFGIIGNAINIVVYQRSQKNSTHVYLIALYFSDIIRLLNDFMYFLVSLAHQIDAAMGERLFFTLYYYTHYIFVQSGVNTSWLTCAIAFDRYLAVGETQVRKADHNYLQSMIVSAVMFSASAIIAIPAPMLNKIVQEYDKTQGVNATRLEESDLGKSNFGPVYHYLIASLRSFVPILLLIVLNSQIIRTVYHNKMKRQLLSHQRSSKNTQANVTTMLITILLIFIFCTIPDAIMSAMRLGYANEGKLVRGIREITDVLLAINSAVTFPICYYFSVQFRQKFKQLFRREREHEPTTMLDRQRTMTLQLDTTKIVTGHSRFNNSNTKPHSAERATLVPAPAAGSKHYRQPDEISSAVASTVQLQQKRAAAAATDNADPDGGVVIPILRSDDAVYDV